MLNVTIEHIDIAWPIPTESTLWKRQTSLEPEPPQSVGGYFNGEACFPYR